MALSENKTDTPKLENKEKPQTNGSLKIRKIIIKIMEIAIIFAYVNMHNLISIRSHLDN